MSIYGPMIYMVLHVMLLTKVNPFRGQKGGGWAREIETFLGPVKWHLAIRRVPFGAQRSRDFQGPTSSQNVQVMDLPKSQALCTLSKIFEN
jgi:hypothetical protein